MRLKKILAVAMTCGMLLSFIPSTAMAATAGWQGSDASGWQYCTSDGSYVKNAWKQIGGKWYYFGEDGYALLDTWAFVDGKLYHFGKSGAMDKNKWISCGDYKISEALEELATRYAKFDEVLDEFRNLKNWRYVGSDGAAYTGWNKVGNDWYFFEDGRSDIDKDDPEGGLGFIHYGVLDYYDRVTRQENVYIFDTSGRMLKNGWQQGLTEEDGINWYYLDSTGRALTGWQKINGKWYYLNENFSSLGQMCTGLRIFNTGSKYEVYLFSQDGDMLNNGWNSYSGHWYYCKSDGLCYSNEWLYSGGKWYYFNFWGESIANKTGYVIDGVEYNFDTDGVCTDHDKGKNKGWFQEEKSSGETVWYYAGDDGVTYKNKWLKSNGSWYYFNESGIMVTDRKYFEIDRRFYSFDKDGKCTNHDSMETLRGWFKLDYSSGTEWVYLGSDGRYVTGWQNINNKWYYFSPDYGTMYDYGPLEIDGKYYYFKPSGEMVTGWYQRDGYWWYYAGSDGVIYHGKWLNKGGKWYYFSAEDSGLFGTMLINVKDYEIDGKLYDFDSSGVCLNPSSSSVRRGWFYDYGNTSWYYYDSDGVQYKQKWLSYNGYWYYFNKSGLMLSDGWYSIGNNDYYFDSEGRWIKDAEQ
ncbi:hypothetical protein [Butyrivibrio sp. AE2032]|uniref:hypothetical protein n=1 Tax=Butyrivibrio sp. AE2032 TaxID=1458463 RepID=UPI000556D52C|nr:hypothetical protein [Butyrivibrio sp. AE2032]